MIAADDPIFYWNAVALEANRDAHTAGDPADAPQTGPTMSSRALAIVHLAMHDAHFGVVNPTAMYLQHRIPSAKPGPNERAAVASAAATALSALYPSRRPMFEGAMLGADIPSAGADVSATWGRAIAVAILARLAVRADEPGATDRGYVASPAPGCHRRDPDNPDQPYHGPYYGTTARPIAITACHGLDSPAGWPAPEDANYEKDLAATEYLSALEEVRVRGGAPGQRDTDQSADETTSAIYWAYDGAKGLGTPPRMYNQIVRKLLRESNTVFSTDDTARAFALVNAAMGDAGLLAWREKYRHDLWRPVVGIREKDPANGGDPSWLPLGSPRTNEMRKSFTPPFPAYPSGHATFGAAAFQMLRLFLRDPSGTNKEDPRFVDAHEFEFVSDELDGRSTDERGAVRTRHVRRFSSLWHAIFENALSRVYLGVHWVFDAFDASDVQDDHGNYKDAIDITYTKNVGGVPLGLAIADDIWINGLKEPELTSPCKPPAEEPEPSLARAAAQPGAAVAAPQPAAAPAAPAGGSDALPRLNLESTQVR